MSGNISTVPERELLSTEHAAAGTSGTVEDAQRKVADLYMERGEEFLRYASALSRDQDLVKDALQEAFMRYFVALCRSETVSSPRAWIYRVLHNYLIDQMKERRRERDSHPAHALVSRQDQQIERECFEHELIAQIRDELTTREYDCIRLRTQGLRYQEIAARLNLTSGSVGTLISRAIRKLRRFAGPREKR